MTLLLLNMEHDVRNVRIVRMCLQIKTFNNTRTEVLRSNKHSQMAMKQVINGQAKIQKVKVTK